MQTQTQIIVELDTYGCSKCGTHKKRWLCTVKIGNGRDQLVISQEDRASKGFLTQALAQEAGVQWLRSFKKKQDVVFRLTDMVTCDDPQKFWGWFWEFWIKETGIPAVIVGKKTSKLLKKNANTVPGRRVRGFSLQRKYRNWTFGAIWTKSLGAKKNQKMTN